MLVDGDPERGERAGRTTIGTLAEEEREEDSRDVPRGLEGGRVTLADIVLAIGIGVEVHLTCSCDGGKASCGGKSDG